jgi:transcriptional regulator with XRE-family HTH domain
MSLGVMIRDARIEKGWSQGQLAGALRERSGRATITREEISRWETGKRVPGPFWINHLEAVLGTPQGVLERERVKRRTFLSAVAMAGLLPTQSAGEQATEIFSSLAGGDYAPLTQIQTAHRTDLAIAAMTQADHRTVRRLHTWMGDGDSDVLRVNAAGILAKTREFDVLDDVARTLSRDVAVRELYTRAVVARVGASPEALMREVANPIDAGARWCAAVLLGRDGGASAKSALLTALRTEPVRENIRTIALVLQGESPCFT